MLYDISPLIGTGYKVWPGDTPLTREVLQDFAHGDQVTLSTLRSTVHIGAHADAPSHYGPAAPAIADRPLDLYLGRCQVMRVPAAPGTRVSVADLTAPVAAERILLATDTVADPRNWNTDFAALAPELVTHLHERGVRLVGIDTPSVDLFDAPVLVTHQAFLRHDMAILEGLVLRDIPAGFYELIALPLKLANFDGSPVRAVLRSPPGS